MNRRRLTAIGFLACVGAAVPGGGTASAAGDGYWQQCGTRVVGEALLVTTKAHAVPCKLARRVGKQYAKGELAPLGFECTEPQSTPSGEVQKGTCRREGARIKVSFGI